MYSPNREWPIHSLAVAIDIGMIDLGREHELDVATKPSSQFAIVGIPEMCPVYIPEVV
jgi:hypothetical protein